MNWIRRMMYGRYGADQLNYTLLGLYLILSILAGLLNSGLLRLLAGKRKGA